MTEEEKIIKEFGAMFRLVDAHAGVDERPRFLEALASYKTQVEADLITRILEETKENLNVVQSYFCPQDCNNCKEGDYEQGKHCGWNLCRTKWLEYLKTFKPNV